MKLGMRGLSVLFSSKDFGVSNSICLTNYGNDRTKFLPMFHVSCACFAPQISTITNHINLGPYVTTVGGINGTAPEWAVDFSGGGFSNYFDRPPYQSNMV